MHPNTTALRAQLNQIKTLRKELESAPAKSQPRLVTANGKMHFVNRNSVNPFARLKSHIDRKNERKAASLAVEKIIDELADLKLGMVGKMLFDNERRTWNAAVSQGRQMNNHDLLQILKSFEKAIDDTKLSPGSVGASLKDFKLCDLEKMLSKLSNGGSAKYADVSAFYDFLRFVGLDNVEQIQDIWKNISEGRISRFNWHEKDSILKVAKIFGSQSVAAISHPQLRTIVMVAQAIQRGTPASMNAVAPAQNAQPPFAKPALPASHDLAKQRPQVKNFADSDAAQLATAFIDHADQLNKTAADVRAFQKFLKHVLPLSQEQVGDAWIAIQSKSNSASQSFTKEEKKSIQHFAAQLEKRERKLNGYAWFNDVRIVARAINQNPH